MTEYISTEYISKVQDEDTGKIAYFKDSKAREDIETLNSQFKEIVNLKSNGNTSVKLDYWKTPEQPDTWKDSDGSGKNFPMNAETFLSTFYDNYIGTQTDGYKVTKTSLGKDQTNTYDIYEFLFEPKNYTQTIILTAGIHSEELVGEFALARLIYYIMENPDIHPSIRYIRDNVRIATIPLQNPWGFSQSPKIYGNSNGVNPNRNFNNGVNEWANIATGLGNEWNYKGTAPFSENETKIIRDFYIKYKDAKFAIDCHTGSYGDQYDHWGYYVKEDTTFAPKMLEAVEWLSSEIKTELGREAVNDMRQSNNDNKLYYCWDYLNMPSMYLEWTPKRFGGDFNGSKDLTHYLKNLANIVIRGLDSNVTQKYETDRNVNAVISRVNQPINFRIMTTLEYNTLPFKDDTTLYMVKHNGIYLGTILIANIGNSGTLDSYTARGLKSYMNFANTTGTSITDTFNSSYTATLINCITSTNYVETTSGESRIEYSFPLMDTVNSEEWSIELKFNRGESSDGNTSYLLAQGKFDNKGLVIYISSDKTNTYIKHLQDSTGVYSYVEIDNYHIPINTDIILCLTYASGILTLYINGNLIKTASAATPGDFMLDNLILGNLNNEGTFNRCLPCKYYYSRIYNVCLTASEVSQNANYGNGNN